jgi:hypothetical protein
VTAGDVPDAVAALIAAVIEDNPFAPPRRQAQLAVEALRQERWRITAPGAGRPTNPAVPAPDRAGAPEAA